MFSRLTAIAAAFSIFATASIAVAAHSHYDASAAQVTAKSRRVIQLDTVVVVAKRVPKDAR